MPTPLSTTPRTELNRHRERGRDDRAELIDVLSESLICHLGLLMNGHPVVLPTVFGVDPDGPDRDGTLYLHGSVAATSLTQAPAQTVCATCTLVDGLVLARSGFNHSMNYRSAVVIGTARLVTDPDEKQHALDLVVDHVVPGRSATLRRYTRKELAATTVVALPLHEASVKRRVGGPKDDNVDVAAGVWAGLIPISVRASGDVETDISASGVPVPDDVVARAASLG